MSWETETTKTFDEWIGTLSDKDKDSVFALVELLEDTGPTLGRPAVDSIKGSRHKNMKELRPGSMRVLFAFDPDRKAIMLVGGDKSNQWKSWYKKMIPVADDLLDEHLQRVAEE